MAKFATNATQTNCRGESLADQEVLICKGRTKRGAFEALLDALSIDPNGDGITPAEFQQIRQVWYELWVWVPSDNQWVYVESTNRNRRPGPKPGSQMIARNQVEFLFRKLAAKRARPTD